MAIKLTTPDALARENGITILIYGRAGTGKTMLAATCPDPVLITAERGAVTLLSDEIEHIHGPGKKDVCYSVPTVEAYSVKKVKEAFKWVIESDEAKQFKTVFIDAATCIASLMYDGAKTGLDAESKTGNADGRQVHFKARQDFLKMIRKLLHTSDKNIVMTCYEKVIKATEDDPETFGPDMPSAKTSREIMHPFEYVWRTCPEDGKRPFHIQTQSDEYCYCKTKGSRLQKYEPAHLGRIFEKLLKHEEPQL